MPHHRPGAGHQPQGLPVDFGVDRGGQHTPMAQDLADLGQRPASVQHGGCRGVPQPVSTDQADTGPPARVGYDRGDGVGGQRPVWCLRPDEDHPLLSRAGARAAQVLDDGLPDIAWQREPVETVALAPHGNLAAAPVNIVEGQRRDLSGSQSEPDQQCEDREVPAPRRGVPVAGG